MTILAATLPGGANNQDRYVVGDNFAAVLDGATSVANDRSHDPGWYAEQLAHALAETVPDGRPLAAAVADAIRTVRDTHRLVPETTPTCTVALVRWSTDTVETYVLGHSLVVLFRLDGTTIHTDDRIGSVAADERATYRARLAAGSGYDSTHRALLMQLQAEQARHRNKADGYWIAGAEPEAAAHGLTTTTDRASTVLALLATDGVALDRHPKATAWSEIFNEARRHLPARVLRRIQDAESKDPDGQRWPRAKRHDDKTLITINFYDL